MADLGFSALKWGLTPQDVLSNADILLVSLSGFVLLGLAVNFVPHLVALIRDAISVDEDEDESGDED